LTPSQTRPQMKAQMQEQWCRNWTDWTWFSIELHVRLHLVLVSRSIF